MERKSNIVLECAKAHYKFSDNFQYFFEFSIISVPSFVSQYTVGAVGFFTRKTKILVHVSLIKKDTFKETATLLHLKQN